jgi:hypothetical protein
MSAQIYFQHNFWGIGFLMYKINKPKILNESLPKKMGLGWNHIYMLMLDIPLALNFQYLSLGLEIINRFKLFYNTEFPLELQP